MKINYLNILILFIFSISLMNCSDDDLNISRLERAQNAPPYSGVGIDVDIETKKGIGMAYKETTWSTRIGRLKPFWHYSWNRDLKENIPDSVEFVPMFWGSGSVNNVEIDKIKDLVIAGKVKNVLGFNEPDLETQSNLTVDEAISLWPKLEEIGVPLGSPAPAGLNNGWLDEFMLRAEQENLRVDFICIHLYRGNNPQLFIEAVDNVFQKYNKPIWITEMAVRDNLAVTIEDNRYTTSQILGTMRTLLPELYNRKYVKRFAWFSGTKDSPNFPKIASSVLYDKNDMLTELGEYYANYKPNLLSGPGSDPEIEIVTEVQGNLLENGTFETGDLEPWAGFKNSVISSAAQEPNTGNYLARIDPHDGSLFQIIDVEPEESYEFIFFHRWKTKPQNTFNAVIRNEVGNKIKFVEYEVPKNDEWTENKIEFEVPEGVNQARVVFYKPQLDPLLPSIFLDDIVVIKK